MVSHKQRMLMALRGEMPDRIPFAPRLDLWYVANRSSNTLPEKYRDKNPDDIARAEGWAIHKINPAYQEVRRKEDHLHWGLGILSLREMVFGYRFPEDVEFQVKEDENRTRISYTTPFGTITTSVLYSEEMRRSGVTAFHIEEPAIKTIKDYAPLAYIFENIQLYPDWNDFITLQNRIGEDGLPFTMAGRAASPMHHIQKYLIGATDFFLHYKEHHHELKGLAESLTPFFDQIIDIITQSPAQVVYWGGNFDDMITFPTYFAEDIMPWIRKASEIFGAKGIYVSCHCDGENKNLMDFIRDSGMHVAEAICPHPMTKVPIEEYYARWSDRLTLFGGIPSILLLEESTSDEDFDSFINHLFKAVAPGRRMIFGVADSVPPHAVFSRLEKLGERIEKEGHLPLKAGTYRPFVPEKGEPLLSESIMPRIEKKFEEIQQSVLNGDYINIKKQVLALLEKKVSPEDILHKGMLPAMEVISERFKTGNIFIPEVLLSAKTMNEATLALEPYFSKEKNNVMGKVLIGTVKGDLHDIGKNIVITMLRGVGFEVKDLGINVSTQEFIKSVREYKPHILGLSALLTTTMQEMKKVIEQLEKEGLRNEVKIIVGGAPLNKPFANYIGADGYAKDAGEAVKLAKFFISKD